MQNTTIIELNEIAKLNANSGGVAGVGSQWTTEPNTSLISKVDMSITSFDVVNYMVQPGSTSYMRGFNHGNGQFSLAAVPFYEGSGSPTQTQFYVKPYRVDQSTGVITEGTGSAIWTNSSGRCNSTTTYGVAGPYLFNTGNHCGPGQGGNNPITTVAFVNNNTVSGTYNNHGTFQPNNNDDSFATWNGSTAYWTPGVYNGSNFSTRYRWSATSSGGSLSNLSTDVIGTNSDLRLLPVIKQYGTNGPTGSVHLIRTSSGNAMTFSIVDSTGAGQGTQVKASSIGYYSGTDTAVGLELSNGRQIFYFSNGFILLKNGNSLSSVTGTATNAPFTSNETPNSYITPVGPDKWIAISKANGVAQVVKFSVDPLTYKITIIGSYPLAQKFNSTQTSTLSYDKFGAFITGNNNQFLVLAIQNTNAASAVVHVFSNSLNGVS